MKDKNKKIIQIVDHAKRFNTINNEDVPAVIEFIEQYLQAEDEIAESLMEEALEEEPAPIESPRFRQ